MYSLFKETGWLLFAHFFKLNYNASIICYPNAIDNNINILNIDFVCNKLYSFLHIYM